MNQKTGTNKARGCEDDCGRCRVSLGICITAHSTKLLARQMNGRAARIFDLGAEDATLLLEDLWSRLAKATPAFCGNNSLKRQPVLTDRFYFPLCTRDRASFHLRRRSIDISIPISRSIRASLWGERWMEGSWKIAGWNQSTYLNKIIWINNSVIINIRPTSFQNWRHC